MPTITKAERTPDGSLHVVIEVAPATAVDEAITREFTWGKDVPEATALREAAALIEHEYQGPAAVKSLEGRAIVAPATARIIGEREAKAAAKAAEEAAALAAREAAAAARAADEAAAAAAAEEAAAAQPVEA